MKLICYFLFSLLFIPHFLASAPLDFSNDWQVSFDNGKTFEDIAVPKNLGESSKLNSEILIYRKTFFWNEPTENSSCIRLGIILDKDQTFLNGTLIGETGIWEEKSPGGYDKIRIYCFPARVLQQGNNEMKVHVKKYFSDEIGIAGDKIQMGTSQEILEEFFHFKLQEIVFLVLYLPISFYFLFLFFRRKSETSYYFFGIFTLNLICYQFLRTQWKFDLEISYTVLKKWEYLFLPTLIPFMAHFLRAFTKNSWNRVWKIADLLTLVGFIGVLLGKDVLQLDSWNRNFVQIVWVFYIGLGFSALVFSKTPNKFGVKVLWIGILGIIASGFIDVLNARMAWNLPRISGYAFSFNVFLEAILLSNEFVSLQNQLETWNSHLEQTVQERTEELKSSLEKVQSLNETQNGDYFLTSLLLKPFASPSKETDRYRIDSYLKQKKEFSFRGKTLEIGGDLNLFQEIQLDGKPYLVFLNSDSMGKSIQGAGGAIVLGTAFHSYCERNKDCARTFPEDWLAGAYSELQSIFLTFQGSMFASCILGIFHLENSTVFLLNFEHPFPVLKTELGLEFLGKDAIHRKLGVATDEKLGFLTFQLHPGDVLILGSDGRDDRILDGKMNEDETLFLKVLETTSANFEKTLDVFKQPQELADDLSLLFLTSKVPNSTSQPSKSLKQILNGFSRKDFGKMLIELETYLESNPSSSIAMFLIALCHFKLKNASEALRWSRRVLHYDSNFEKNNTLLRILESAAQKEQNGNGREQESKGENSIPLTRQSWDDEFPEAA